LGRIGGIRVCFYWRQRSARVEFPQTRSERSKKTIRTKRETPGVFSDRARFVSRLESWLLAPAYASRRRLLLDPPRMLCGQDRTRLDDKTIRRPTVIPFWSCGPDVADRSRPCDANRFCDSLVCPKSDAGDRFLPNSLPRLDHRIIESVSTGHRWHVDQRSGRARQSNGAHRVARFACRLNGTIFRSRPTTQPFSHPKEEVF